MEPHTNVYYIESRGGTTGQGFTFEGMVLDKTEDNRAEADIYDTEIKTCSSKSKSARIRVATVTFVNSIGDETANTVMLRQFGKVNKKGKVCFNRSIRCNKPVVWDGVTVNLRLDDEALRLDAGVVQVHVPRSVIDEMLTVKLANLAVIKTKVRKSEHGKAYNYHGFHYFGGLNREAFWAAVEAGVFSFEFRLRGKDHGTSININLNRIADIYSEMVEWNGA